MSKKNNMETHRKHNTPKYIFTILVLISLFFAGCTTIQEAVPDDIAVQLSWTHYAAFGGLYAAEQNGYFSEQDLAVEFLEGGIEVDDIEAVTSGRAQFGVAGADEVITARAAGAPVKAIAVLYKISPVVFVAPMSANIHHPEDFLGRTVRTTPQINPSLHALLDNIGLPQEGITRVILPSTIDSFENGEADVWGVYLNSFAVALEAAGYDLSYVYPHDYRVRFYGETIYTTDEIVENQPGLVERFLAAVLQGSEYAVQHSDEIGQMVTLYEPSANADLETEKMEVSIPLILDGQDEIGWMLPEVWEEMVKAFQDQGLIPVELKSEEVYTNKFIEQYYGSDQ